MLLLEAGGKDRSPNIKIPAAFANQFHTKLDWDYYTEPEPHVDGRELYIPRGKSLGGSSSMNAMLYVRGRPLDYDLWEAQGAPGWGWDDVLPYFLRSEDNARGGVGVPRRRRAAARVRAALAAADGPPPARGQRGRGHPARPRLQRARAGRRVDVPGQPAARPALERGRRAPAPGAEAPEPRGAHRRARPAGGARGRPRGRRPLPRPRGREQVGARRARGHPLRRRDRLAAAAAAVRHRAADHLREVGVEVRHDLPGVGRNLQDHPFVTVLFWEVRDQQTLYGADKPKPMAEWLLRRTGPLTSSVAEVVAFVRTRAGPARRRRPVPHGRRLLRGPRRRGVRRPRAGHRAGAGVAAGARAGLAALGRPGRQAADPHQLAVRARRRRARSWPAWSWRARSPRRSRCAEIVPASSSRAPAVTDREDLEADLRRRLMLIYHPVGTCRMGDDGEDAVVDAELRVHGIEACGSSTPR